MYKLYYEYIKSFVEFLILVALSLAMVAVGAVPGIVIESTFVIALGLLITAKYTYTIMPYRKHYNRWVKKINKRKKKVKKHEHIT